MEKNENFKSELETQYNILIKANEKKESQRFKIILSIISITLLCVLISLFFSYKAFISSKNINDNEKKGSSTHYRTLSIVYNGDSNLNLSGIGNGYELSNPKVIQITNDGDSDVTFDLKLNSINTSLLSTNNFVYQISTNGESSNYKEFPLTDKTILQDVLISPEQTLTYIIRAKFTGTIEQNNYSNYYNSKIVIEQKDDKSNLLE